MNQNTELNRPRKLIGRISDVDLHLMRVFQTVVDCGGFSAAQSELGVGRSTISRQISHLEVRLGFTLCYRGRSGFKLTQHGEQAQIFINQFLASADEFMSNIATINDNFSGEIDVAMIDASFTDPQNPMLGAIRAFRDLAPRVKINLAVETPEQIEKGVLDGKFHLGILPYYRELPELSYRNIYKEKVALFAGPSHPLIDELKTEPNLAIENIVKHELVNRGYLEGDSLKAIKSRFELGPTVFETEAVAALVISGAYLGFLPQFNAHSALISVLPEQFEYSVPICVVTKKSRQHSVITQAFTELLI